MGGKVFGLAVKARGYWFAELARHFYCAAPKPERYEYMHHVGVFDSFVQDFLIRFGKLDVVLFHEPVYGGGEVERRNHHIPFCP